MATMASERLGFSIARAKSVPFIMLIRRFSALWATKKDPDLESALSRNKRWIVNSRLKNIILRCPNQVAPIKFLQKKFKTLDLQGKALNWLKKYPCCFDVYLQDDEYYCRLTKPMMTLVEEEELVKDSQEPVFADRLAKLLMMSVNHRLNVVKLNEFKRSFGFTDDYVIRIVPKYSDVFRLVNYSGRKSSMEIELLLWKPELAVSAVEAAARESGSEPSFTCSLPSTWTKPWERFVEFNASPYVSPYQEDPVDIVEGSKESEKRSVGLVHELLSLTLWKKLSMVKLSHFKREFSLPEKLNGMLLKYPGIFYVANKYQVHTVLLREGYNGTELVHKDPLVVVKDKYGELMQQGLYEYNRRRYLANVEKKREKGIESVKDYVVRKKDRIGDGDSADEQENHGDSRPGGMFDPEERKRLQQKHNGSEIKSKFSLNITSPVKNPHQLGMLWSQMKPKHNLKEQAELSLRSLAVQLIPSWRGLTREVAGFHRVATFLSFVKDKKCKSFFSTNKYKVVY